MYKSSRQPHLSRALASLFVVVLIAEPGFCGSSVIETQPSAQSAVDAGTGKGIGDASGSATAAETVDSAFFYFVNGQVPGNRVFTVGDNKEWGMPIERLRGESAGGKLTVEPVDYKSSNDAIRAVWSKARLKGELALTGEPIDLAALEGVAALTFDVKVEVKPTQEVYLALDCGWPCRGEIKIGNLLRKYKRGEWHSFPLPLSCFKGDSMDFTKVGGIFLLTTEGRLSVSIANIRLERMSDGEQGCKS